MANFSIFQHFSVSIFEQAHSYQRARTVSNWKNTPSCYIKLRNMADLINSIDKADRCYFDEGNLQVIESKDEEDDRADIFNIIQTILFTDVSSSSTDRYR